jgi:hypothetical protein
MEMQAGQYTAKHDGENPQIGVPHYANGQSECTLNTVDKKAGVAA